MAYVERSTGGDNLIPSSDAVSFTYSPAAGSNRLALICCAAANLNDQVNTCWPATLSWGGQTINRTLSVSDNNAHAALYLATESQIAALSGGVLSISLVDEGTNIGLGDENTPVVVALYEDVEQTLADSDSVLDGATLTLTTTAGDLVFGFMGARSDNSPTTADTSRWSLNPGGGTNIQDAKTLGAEKTASGTSTQIDIGGSPAQCGFIAVAMTPTAAATDALPAAQRSTPRGALRTGNSGAI
jgi:hypothetical protein